MPSAATPQPKVLNRNPSRPPSRPRLALFDYEDQDDDEDDCATLIAIRPGGYFVVATPLSG
jgi:hypothetical protein